MASREHRLQRRRWRIQFDFDAEVIRQLKALVPSDCREWDAEGKTWWIGIEHAEGPLRKLFPSLVGYMNQWSML